MQDPSKMSVAELREMAKTLGVKGYEKLKKAEAYDAVMSILDPGHVQAAAAGARAAKESPSGESGDGKSAAPRRGRPPKKRQEQEKPAAGAEKPAAKTEKSVVKEEKPASKATKAAKAEKPAAKNVKSAAKTEKAAARIIKISAKTEKSAVKAGKSDARPEEEKTVRSETEAETTGTGRGRKKTAEKKTAKKNSRDEMTSARRGRPRKIVRDDAAIKEHVEEIVSPEPDGDDEELAAARAEAEERRAAAKARAAAFGIDLPPGVEDFTELESGELANGILEVMPEGYGFLRSSNYMPGEKDIYVSPSQIKRFSLRTGDVLEGPIRIKTGNEKFSALLYPGTVNGMDPSLASSRKRFESMTPIFPNERIHLERTGGSMSMRIMDLISPVGKGQRGMIVSPPKAGKTTLLKDVAMSVKANHPEMKLIILLIDERPEEVTDIKESIEGPNVEVIYSTFDELPEHHKRVSEMVLNRAKRLVEQGEDVMILLDSITRLSRAYNLVVAPSGRTLSGGLDPAALYMPKKFFGAARNMREGGSLTILATALVDTGSRMDDVVFEEFKGTGNMELVLDRKLSEKRVFPAMDIMKSGTRRDDLLLSQEEYDTMYMIRKAVSSLKPEEATEKILDLFAHTKTNGAFLQFAHKIAW